MTLFEISIIFGAMAGWAGFFYLIYKSRMDKTKLEFEEDGKFFYPAEGNNYHTVVVVRLKAHNKGTKATTIYYSRLDFNYNSKSRAITDDRSSARVPANSTVNYQPSMNLHKDEIILYDKITNCVLTVKHTFGKKVHYLGIIEQLKK